MAKNFWKKMLSVILTFAMVMSIGTVAFAEESKAAAPSIGTKTAECIDGEPNKCWVEIEVPGADGDTRHDEVILMVDGPYSMDNEWPAMKEVPVAVELVDPANYTAGGDDVIGNESGDIYKLIWYVKDGAMLRSDTYSLQYQVAVDTKEAGFSYDRDYPANGNTDLHYKDENGTACYNPIVVPNVLAPSRDTAVKFASGSASHICYLYVDKSTGEVIYGHKVDFEDEDTYAEIEAREGYISVVFIKQAQSGIIWASEEVSDDIVKAIVASVKKNDKAYMGHDAVVFGEGEHDLTYAIGNGKQAKTKTVTYTFTAE